MRRLPLNVPQVAPLIDTHSVTYTLGEFYAKGGNNEYQKYPTCNSHSNTAVSYTHLTLPTKA